MDTLHYSKVDFLYMSRLFSLYLDELRQIQGTLPGNGTNEQRFHDVFNTPHTDWYHLLSDDESVIGFVVIGHGLNCHPKADYFFAEAYVLPEYRGQGYLHLWVHNFLEINHVNLVSMFILGQNTHAARVWGHIFASEGFSYCDLPDYSGSEGSILVQLGWKRRKPFGKSLSKNKK